MNKKGGYSDLFIFIIVAFIIVVISGAFIYIGNATTDQLHETMDSMATKTSNTTEIIDNSMGKVNLSYSALYWISLFIIIGMIIAIFIGSYLVTTRPVFFVPYIFVMVISIMVSVGISNAYEKLVENATIGATYLNFVGANYFLANLPIWVTIIGFIGSIIMFARLGSREQANQYYG